jgi:hypothetical protein
MSKKALIVNKTFYYSPGQIVEGEEIEEGLLVGSRLVYKGDYINLNEALTVADEEKVRNIVRDLIKKMLWRWYTRSSFFLK